MEGFIVRFKNSAWLSLDDYDVTSYAVVPASFTPREGTRKRSTVERSSESKSMSRAKILRGLALTCDRPQCSDSTQEFRAKSEQAALALAAKKGWSLDILGSNETTYDLCPLCTIIWQHSDTPREKLVRALHAANDYQRRTATNLLDEVIELTQNFALLREPSISGRGKGCKYEVDYSWYFSDIILFLVIGPTSVYWGKCGRTTWRSPECDSVAVEFWTALRARMI